MITEFPKEGNIYIDVEGINIDPLQKYLEENGRKYIEICSTCENYLVWDSNNFWYTTNKSTNKKLYTLLNLALFITNKVDWKVGDAFQVIADNINACVLKKGITYYVFSVDNSSVSSTLTKGGAWLPASNINFAYMKKVEEALEPVSLVGRYLKALVNEPQAIGKAKKGDLFLIKSGSANFNIKCVKNTTDWSANVEEIGTTWELMPEGFTPPVIEDYQNILDIEVGDTVKCISENKSKFNKGDFPGGAGFSENLEFVVTEVDKYTGYNIYFGGKNSFGVYSDAVRLVKKKEKPVETPKYEVGKWYRLPKTSNYIVKYSKPHWCNEFIGGKKYNNWGGACNTIDAILVDVSEIQKYLPDGHVDKIKVDVIPEYVECIQDDFHKAWDNTKGKIYKVENGKILSNTSKPGIYIESSLGKSHFKPSTKEAYDKQFMNTYKCLPFPKNISYFTARVVKDIKLKHEWGSLPDIIPAGSITWCYSEKGGDYELRVLNKKGHVCPESNRYYANIPAEYFEILETFTINEEPVTYPEVRDKEEKKGNPLEKKVISIYVPPSKVEGKKEVLFSVLKLKQIKKIF